MKQITVSAPGKLMLLGEHAVVYGYPCIVAAVNKYLTVTISRSCRGKDRINALEVADFSFVKESLKVFRHEFSIKDFFSLRIKSELGNFGLGTSSAVTVATLKALAEFNHLNLDKKELFNLSYKVIQNVQRLGSGFDLATSIWGGTIYFEGKTKKVESLHQKFLPIMAFFSGQKVKTIEMVEKVAQLKKRNSKFVEDIFRKIAKLVEEGRDTVEGCDWVTLGKLMTQNHLFLTQLQVSTPKLDQLVETAIKAGAYGAKLSGAGGGDCMIALVSRKNKKKVTSAIEKVGGKIIDVATNAQGLRIEL